MKCESIRTGMAVLLLIVSAFCIIVLSFATCACEYEKQFPPCVPFVNVSSSQQTEDICMAYWNGVSNSNCADGLDAYIPPQGQFLFQTHKQTVPHAQICRLAMNRAPPTATPSPPPASPTRDGVEITDGPSPKCHGACAYIYTPAADSVEPRVTAPIISSIQSWALEVFLNFFNNKKMIFLHFLSSQ